MVGSMLTPKYTICFSWGKIVHMNWMLTPWLRISLYIYSYNNCTRKIYRLRGWDRKPQAPFQVRLATAIEVYDFRLRRNYGVSIGMKERRRGTVDSWSYQEEYRTIRVDDNREETMENGAIHIDLALQLLRSRECDRIRLFSSALCLRSGLLGTSGSLYPRRGITH